MNDIANPAEAALAAYKAAVFAKDVDAFVALYDANVLVFDMWGSWSCRGLAAWRAMADGWFGSLGEERVLVDFSEVQTIVSPQLVVAHAFVRYAAIDGAGAELRALNNRLSLTLQPTDEGWKIVHEHSSAPLDFETAKAIFTR